VTAQCRGGTALGGTVSASPLASRLPRFTWDAIEGSAQVARSFRDGMIDLSMGTPVDPVPESVQDALRRNSNAPGYPTAYGMPQTRAAAASWLGRRLGVQGVDPDTMVLPSSGSKEAISLLPLFLGVPAGARILHAELAYPTYAVGATIVGAVPEPCPYVASADPSGVALAWCNTPSNPTGAVLSAAALRAAVRWGRHNTVPIAVDECYIDLAWDAKPVSVLHPSVRGGSFDGIVAFYSLSKRSNMAGYRAGFVAGDPAIIGMLLEARKHAGLLVPTPVQAAMAAALADDTAADIQKRRYAKRRNLLRAALTAAGFHIDASEAGLFLWVTRNEDCSVTADWFAERGLLVAPGSFYGLAGNQHVRIALTITDEESHKVAERIVAK
jgi:succinyldiaminopimelate transaminase